MKQIQDPPRRIDFNIKWGTLLGGVPAQLYLVGTAVLLLLFFAHFRSYYGFLIIDQLPLQKGVAFTSISEPDQYGDRALTYRYQVSGAGDFFGETTISREQISGEMEIEYWPAYPEFHKLESIGIPAGITWEFAVSIMFLFLPAMFCLLGFLSTLGYHKQVLRLLRYGLPTEAKLLKKTKVERVVRYFEGTYRRNSIWSWNRGTTQMATGMAEDGAFPLYKLTFSYNVPVSRDELKRYTLTVETRYPQVLEDEPEELLLYNPRNPSEAILFDHLEHTPDLTEDGVLHREEPIVELLLAPLFLLASPVLGYLLPATGIDPAPVFRWITETFFL